MVYYFLNNLYLSVFVIFHLKSKYNNYYYKNTKEQFTRHLFLDVSAVPSITAIRNTQIAITLFLPKSFDDSKQNSLRSMLN